MLGLSIPEVAGRARAGLDPATTALVARMSGAPDAARAALIDAAVRAIKASGVWAKLDLLYLLAAHDGQAARLNWVASGHDLAAVGSPVFTVDRGYAGDGFTSYLSTGWNPASDAACFAAASASMGVWLNAGTNSGVNGAVAMGVSDGTNASILVPRGASNHVRGRLNAAASVESGGAAASRLGLSVLSRTDAGTLSFYRGAGLDGVAASAVSTIVSGAVFLGGSNVSGSLMNGVDNRIAAAFAGAGLSAGEVAALHAALSGYLAAVGAA